MDPKDADSKKQTQGIRRPFGVAGKQNLCNRNKLYMLIITVYFLTCRLHLS